MSRRTPRPLSPVERTGITLKSYQRDAIAFLSHYALPSRSANPFHQASHVMPHTKPKPPCPKVRVSFPMNDATWDVVHAGAEQFSVVKENHDRFVVDYDNRDHFDQALLRFGGLVEYQEIVSSVLV